MVAVKKWAVISAFALASFATPVFAQATLQVFLWNAPLDTEMAFNNKMGDGADRLGDTMGITLNAVKVPAGEVTFNVLNASKEMMHEIVVSKIGGPDAILPYNADIDRINEAGIGSKGEIEDMEPGANGVMTLDLAAGTYALYCNIPGHYSAGMWTLLEVV